MTVVLVTMGLAIVLLAALVIGLLRSHGEILRALHQLGVNLDEPHDTHDHSFTNTPKLRPVSDSAPPDIAGTTLKGSAVKVGVAGVEHRTLLAFLSSTCSACLNLWNELKSDPTAGLNDRLVVVVKGPEAESPSRLRDLAHPEVTVVQSTEAWEEYQVPVSPYFVYVDGPTGDILGEGSIPTWDQVRSVIVQAAADRAVVTQAMASGVDPELRADIELRAAGITPGHPSLYPTSMPIEGLEDEEDES
ncbi:MAG: hypothetical protein DIU67_006460 [Actinomycetes bacterium]|jgi:hypothetical protein|nr:MAG: hypothetical protein DIU67_03835 [Actinomycetota bacterium]